MKYSFNIEYMEQGSKLTDFLNEGSNRYYSHVSPRLRVLLQDEVILNSPYPFWFLAAFPDVAFWTLKGEGLRIITEFTDVQKHLNFELEEATTEQILFIARINDYSTDSSTEFPRQRTTRFHGKGLQDYLKPLNKTPGSVAK